jgi:hypothetical protein
MAGKCGKSAPGDKEIVEAVKNEGRIRAAPQYWLAGTYESLGKIDILMYREHGGDVRPGTSVLQLMPDNMRGAPEVVKDVNSWPKFRTVSAPMPRGYLIRLNMRASSRCSDHNVQGRAPCGPVRVAGEEFVVEGSIGAAVRAITYGPTWSW